MGFDVVVVGSINQDLTLLTPRHPAPGETVLGKGHLTGPGGKGANQAIAAARQGARVAMIGRVGADAYGAGLVSNLVSAGVDVSGVGVDENYPTGLAVITVDDSAENTIVVSQGANRTLSPALLDIGTLGAAKVVLTQLEIPIETVTAAAEATGGLFCLNPAPARALSPELLARVDALIPNRSELGILAGVATPTGLDDAVGAARSIAGPKAVVVTLGSEGAVAIADGAVTQIPAPVVGAVDATGAGDAFSGTLAAALAAGSSLLEAAQRATVAGAIATTRAGAQSALPTLAEVEAALGGES